MAGRPCVSIIIKALNEENRIAACIESALLALETIDGQVILADSVSSDKTVEIAANYAIKIVQLADASERRCGVGPQLGYQVAEGNYVYILDGDMVLQQGFLEHAIDALLADSTLGGVGGLVEEKSEGSLQFRRRKARNVEGIPGETNWLGMGGLYRRSALESVGYMSNRNLFAHEEQELGLRLQAMGWHLERLPIKSADHYGHVEPTLTLLRKRWRSGYLLGAGQALRASFRTPYFMSFVIEHRHLLLTLGFWLLFTMGVLMLPVIPFVFFSWIGAIVLLTIQRMIRHESIIDGLLCIIVWHVSAVALLKGVFMKQIDPETPIAYKIIMDASTQRTWMNTAIEN